ncbi:MAG: sigma-70 family RNA polymerase sigma factor [Polyangiaceae bacterium]|nr:sigma-70 family RNA polymerase sigma factor [Polyangiaceae bacterium]
MPRVTPSPDSEQAPSSGVVRTLPTVRDEEALVAGLRSGQAWARGALFDRYAPDVERILRRILGYEAHTDMADLVHDTFVQVLASFQHIRDAGALRGWIQSIAAHTAYRTIRSRRVRRWLRFWEPSQIPEVAIVGIDPDVREAYRRTYQLLDRMPAEERVVFVLRYVEGMDLGQLAETCRVSLSTVKRRLARAEGRFSRAAERDEVLRTWLKEGGRWPT